MNLNFLQVFSEGVAAAAGQAQTDASANGQTQTGKTETQETVQQPETVDSVPTENETQVSAPEQDDRASLLREELRIRGRERMQDWLAQEKDMQQFYPSFSFHAEYNTNETFARLLRSGAGVREAYEVAHLPQILTCAMQYAAKKAAEKTAAGFRVAANRPLENGLSARRTQPPTEKRVDSLTQADIIRILERVGKGDKVTF